MLVVLVGQDIWSIGLFVSLKTNRDISDQYRWAVDLNEGTLFWAIVGVFAAVVAAFSYSVVLWSRNGFASLALETQFIIGATIVMQVVEMQATLMATSLIRRLVNYNR
jgi:uncharacterized membrane protein YeaQ/YmgE (transglycosylase-associated protein family)